MMGRQGCVAALLAGVGLTARAQCPDGTPPPCRARTAAVASALPRRADPPLDANTWIVLPFDNLAKSPDVEWLRDASVNLLYLDLSKWQDIRVVDDERVADLLRAAPEAQSGKPLTLAVGLAVAKHAGAGRLVMGDLIRLGAKTTVTAKVFDVKGGQRIRTTSQDAAAQDSIMPAFGKLARGILNVVPPTGTNVGEIGTTNTGAYQEYLEGVKALNRFDLGRARARLEAALKIDSTFALAHFKLATAIGWDNPNEPSKMEHARAASRFSGALPARERALVAGLIAFSSAEYGRACAIYGSLIKPDSTDVEAMYGLGDCLYHDNWVEPVNGDTSRARFRSSWNAANRLFERTLVVDPTFHLAFQHILDAHTAENRGGCRPADPTAASVLASSCPNGYLAAVRRDGDSLLIVPVSNRDAVALSAQHEEARRTNAQRNNLLRARAIAQEWVDAGPSEARAIATLGRIDLMLGDVDKADSELSRVTSQNLGEFENLRILQARLEVDLKRGREASFLRTVDSIATHRTTQTGSVVALLLAVTGRLALFDSLITERLAGSRAPPLITAYFKPAPRVLLGLSPEGGDAAEDSLVSLIARSPVSQNGGLASATYTASPTLMFGLLQHRGRWPRIDSLPDPRLGPAFALSRGDTARLLIAARRLDSLGAFAKDHPFADDGSVLIAAEAHLILRDSAAALSALRTMFEQRVNVTPMFNPVANGVGWVAFLWPRGMLLRAELESAIGNKATAKLLFQRVLALWAEADPEFKPLVDRARSGLTALPPG